MKSVIYQPPYMNWASGALRGAPLICKTTHLGDLPSVFANDIAWRQSDPRQPVYRVEMFESPSGEGYLYTGVTHLHPGLIGDEYFMTRGHFHARREQGEIYFGLCGEGLLLLQDEQGKARLEQVSTGSVHIIPGFTAHRLINTGSGVLSALAVWPSLAGHDYAALAQGFALRVVEQGGQVQAKEVQNG
ncbi:glucose-6-phosphate isomerase family protein [Siccibacter turicensis]|uniref:glucose-6-phosphate isomerase n=1 Tax=Siccibacter turicensis TaxID=357233 RepID=A0A2P8VIE0_9ENTR|nr:glucose-6-phosphate isomerase family protein [Siccibacter turicensis]PSN06858.1 glucose-6-phosphate isomerase [Siccibacter turicensis]